MAAETVKTKKKRKRPLWLDKSGALGIAIVVFTIRLMPFRLARFLARCLGNTTYLILGPNRANVGAHLEIAFGSDLPLKKKKELAKAFWKHAFEGVVESLHLAHWNMEICREQVELSHLSQLETLKKKNKGVIVVSAHIGSWEVGPYALGLLGFPIKLLNNPGTVAPIFEYVKKQRERSGMQVISRLEHPWKLKKLLDKGAWVSLAADLNAGRRGTFIPFFEREASTYMSPAALQLASRCPIVVVSTFRRPDGRHQLHVWRHIPYIEAKDHDEGLRSIMLQIHGALEEAIRAHPEQWLWTYRRWRTRPKNEKA